MIRKIVLQITTVLFLAIAVGCGKSDTTEASFTVSGTVTFLDVEFWPEQQNVMFGLFEPGEVQPVSSVKLSKPSENQTSFSIGQVAVGNYEMVVYISENIIRKADLVNFGNKLVEADLQLSNKSAVLVSFEQIQNQIFSNCLQCHGGAEHTAAGLILFPDKSYDMLVNMPALNSDLLRVEPNKANKSFLIRVLNKDNLPFDHSASTTATAGDIQLVNNWINKGAPND